MSECDSVAKVAFGNRAIHEHATVSNVISMKTEGTCCGVMSADDDMTDDDNKIYHAVDM